MPIAKDKIRQIVSENNISNVGDVCDLIGDIFRNLWRQNWMILLVTKKRGIYNTQSLELKRIVSEIVIYVDRIDLE